MRIDNHIKEKILKHKKNYTTAGEPMTLKEFKQFAKEAEASGEHTQEEAENIINSYISSCPKELKRKTS